MPTILADEIAMLNTLRRLQGMAALTPSEVAALEAEHEPAFCPLPPATPEEQAAIDYLSGVTGPAPATTAPAERSSPASGLAGLVVGGGPLTDHERAELAQMDSEYKADGLGPLTADKAAQLVARWRARAA